MKLFSGFLLLVVALPLACTGTNFSGGTGKADAKKSADATGTKTSTDHSQDQKNNTVYVPVGGTKPVPGANPGTACTIADTTVAGCKNGVITGTKVGETTVHTPSTGGSGSGAGGVDTKVVVYDPKHPPPGLDSAGDKAGGIDSANSQNGALGTTNDCLAAKADNYNIMMIFDNSGSQTDTDPTFARRDGALLFIDQWEQYVASNKKARVYMGVLSFNTASIRAAQGWILLSGTNGDDIKSEVQAATANPNGGTAYSPPLNDAASFFTEVNALPNADRQRNYAVFLTDGVPNAAEVPGGPLGNNPPDGNIDPSVLVEQYSDIPKAVTNLVQNFGVAIYAIATGTQVPAEAEPIVQALAQPTTGIKFPDHTGHYYRAHNADELKTVWSSLFNTVGKCN